jgi:hypothetical protein
MIFSENRLPLFGIMRENKKGGPLSYLLQLCGFCGLPQSTPSSCFRKIFWHASARSRPLRSLIRDATVGGEPTAANRNVRLGLMTVNANYAPGRIRFNLEPLRLKNWTKLAQRR